MLTPSLFLSEMRTDLLMRFRSIKADEAKQEEIHDVQICPHELISPKSPIYSPDITMTSIEGPKPALIVFY